MKTVTEQQENHKYWRKFKTKSYKLKIVNNKVINLNILLQKQIQKLWK